VDVKLGQILYAIEKEPLVKGRGQPTRSDICQAKLKIRRLLLFIIGAVELCMNGTQCCTKEIQKCKVKEQDVYETTEGAGDKMTGKGQTRCNQCDIRILLQA
jgi:hypothetical protein